MSSTFHRRSAITRMRHEVPSARVSGYWRLFILYDRVGAILIVRVISRTTVSQSRYPEFGSMDLTR